LLEISGFLQKLRNVIDRHFQCNQLLLEITGFLQKLRNVIDWQSAGLPVSLTTKNIRLALPLLTGH
jgi:hypothetical protein